MKAMKSKKADLIVALPLQRFPCWLLAGMQLDEESAQYFGPVHLQRLSNEVNEGP